MRRDAFPIGLLLVLPALLALVAGPLATAQASPRPSATGAVFTESAQPAALQIKQHSYYRHVSAHNLLWSGWGAPTATAQGTFTFQFCVEESCSVSPFYDESVVVTLSAIGHCGAHPAYTSLQLEASGTLPDSSFKSYRTSLACPKPRSLARRKHG